MDLTPDLLLEAKFAPARRGYDMNEVDDFLERCAEGLDVLLARLRAEFERAEAAEAALAEVRAGGAPVAAPEAQPEAEPAPAPAPTPVRAEEPMRILIAAERTAEAAIADARAEAERIRAEAESVASTTRSEAETMLARARAEAEAEAREAGEQARRAIESEVLALRQDRETLSADVANLRGWLDAQRARLRTTAEELQRLVDDPDRLAEVPAPEVGETTTDAPAEASAEAPPADDDGPAADEPEVDEVVDARGSADLAPGASIFDADDGEPTQAVPRFGDEHLDGPSALFDDERAPTAFSGLDRH
jgi:DivIVA domain-containing protein